jgi:ribosomal protein L7/L12
MGMNSTGQRIILILVVGLTAFSTAMKELNQIQQLTLDASRLVAQWSGKIVPDEVPQAPVVAKVESCEIKQSVPAVELPWLNHVAQAEKSDIEKTVVAKGSKSSKIEVVKRVRRLGVDPVQFEVRIPFNHNADADSDGTVFSEFPVTSFTATPFKLKARKTNTIKINPRDREMLLKTFNRSINLRIAS